MDSRTDIPGKVVLSIHATDLAPWGSPPTPVLPRWYFETLHSTRLPSPLWELSAKTSLRTLGDLATLWEYRSRPLAKEEHDALIRLANRIARPPDYQVVIPEGLHIGLLLRCPLKVRTVNCLRRELDEHLPSPLAFTEPDPVGEMTVGDLLRITNFGLVSLLDLMCVIESAQSLGYFREPAVAHPYAQSPSALSAHSALPAQAAVEPPDPADIAWESTVVVLQRLLAAAAGVNGSRTLADALSSDLGGLATTLGMADHLAGIPLADLTGEPDMANESLAALSQLWESLSPTEQVILHKRMLAADPITLEELGEMADLTRERIRQIEKRIESRLNHPSITGPAVKCWIGVLAILLRRKLGPITSQSNLEERISATFPTTDDPEEHKQAVIKMARQLLQQELDYSYGDDLCLSPEARTAIKKLKEQASLLADEIGLIDNTALRNCLPDEAWQQHWEALLQQAGLQRLNGLLALRDTAKAKAKAALLAIGRPASKEEVGELSGLRPDRAGAQLSLLPGVVRADKHRWGLAEWVEDEYEGIPAEIIQRINEDGGSTRLNRLLEELPRMFGVAESSVKAYLDTPAFHVEHGWVKEAEDPTLFTHRLEDIVDGYDDNGDPYWEFEVEDRHLDGYSLHGVPGEVAVALGCGFGDKTIAMVRSPAGCSDISIIWRKTSILGPEIGRLGSALRILSIYSEERAILIIHSESEVSFAPAPNLDQRIDGNARSTLRSIYPHLADQPRQFKGVKVGVPIVGRITTSTPVQESQPGINRQDCKGSEN